MSRSEHYRRAGVDIDAADALIDRFKPLADSTRVAGATAGLGGFGGIFDLEAAGFGAGTRLVAGTDGVGTKLKVAFAVGKHDTIGVDCVAMCVNDILAVGAKPLFFLDYFATGRLEQSVGAAVMQGVAEGCRQSGCWLLGGETAELPGMYADGEYDLAGFVVGAVRPDEERDPARAAAGDIVIALPSSGIHSNGYSLARRVLLEDAGLPLGEPLPNDSMPLGERLLVPTRIYVRLLERLRDAGHDPKAVAHITGGGLWDNPQRSVDESLAVELDAGALRAMVPPIFAHISGRGGVPEREMYRVFNMGVGMTLVAAPEEVDGTLAALAEAGEEASVIGRLRASDDARVIIDGLADAPLSAP